MRVEMRNAEKDLKYLMRFSRGDIEAIAIHWINQANQAQDIREALKHACIAVEIYSGSCPYDKHDSCQFPGRCTDQYSECWQEYFISKVKPPGERTDSK